MAESSLRVNDPPKFHVNFRHDFISRVPSLVVFEAEILFLKVPRSEVAELVTLSPNDIPKKIIAAASNPTTEEEANKKMGSV